MFAYFNRILDSVRTEDPMAGAFEKAFIPERDITAWELAEIFSNVPGGPVPPSGGVHFTPDVWDGLVWGIKRHFKDMPK